MTDIGAYDEKLYPPGPADEYAEPAYAPPPDADATTREYMLPVLKKHLRRAREIRNELGRART